MSVNSLNDYRLTKNRVSAESALSTKLCMPGIRQRPVIHHQSCALLNASAPKSVTVVYAPGGYGKTTLVAQWLSNHNYPIAWLTLDEFDNDPTRFLFFIIAAIRQTISEFGKQEIKLLQLTKPPALITLLPSLLQQIQDANQNIHLVLDDYHVITDPAILVGMQWLIEHASDNLSLTIVSNTKPEFNLHTQRLNQNTVIIQQQDLMLDASNTSQLINLVLANPICTHAMATQIASELHSAAELQLMALVISHSQSIQEVIAGLNQNQQRPMHYLYNELFSHLDDHSKEFLLLTSNLNKFCAPLCDFVLERSNCKQIIEQLVDGQLFVEPLDARRKWYRYHESFKQFLQHRLEIEKPEVEIKLFQRAAQWYHLHGDYDDAIYYVYKAAQPEMAARWIEDCFEEYYFAGRIVTLLNWFSWLPDDIIQCNPNRIMCFAWISLVGRAVEFNDFVQVAEKLLNADKTFSQYPPDMHNKLHAQIAGYRGFNAMQHNEISDAIGYLEKAMPVLEKFSQQNIVMPLMYLGVCYSQAGDLDLARDYFEHALDLGLQQSNILSLPASAIGLAFLYYKLGKYNDAHQLLVDTIGEYNELGLHRYVDHAWFNLALAALHYEHNELEDSQRCIDIALSYLDHDNQDRLQIFCLINQARILVARDDLEKARDIIEASLICQQLPSVLPVLPDPILMRFKLYLQLGETEKLADWVESINEDYSPQKESSLLLLVRYRLARGQLNRCEVMLDNIISAAKQDARNSVLVEALILQSRYFLRMSAIENAHASLSLALGIAHNKGYVRLFIDDYSYIEPLIQSIANNIGVNDENDSGSDYLAVFASHIINAASETGSTTENAVNLMEENLAELDQRERKTLQLLASGLSNREIAERLYLSTSSIKAQLKKIYGKLNVSTRSQAILHAKNNQII